jgi:FMN phosphatase YigB (HAD superfamily)
MNNKILFLDGDGTIWYPASTKRTLKPHWIYHDETTKNNFLEHLELTPRVKETLTKFKNKGIKIFLVSASPHEKEIAEKELELKLNHFGLENLFDGVFSSDGSNPNGKGQLMLDILKSEGLKLSDALMVGDSYFYDYLAAKNNGIDAFWIENTVAKIPDVFPESIQKISELSDLINIL